MASDKSIDVIWHIRLYDIVDDTNNIIKINRMMIMQTALGFDWSRDKKQGQCSPKLIFDTLHWIEMDDDSNGRWPFRLVSNGQRWTFETSDVTWAHPGLHIKSRVNA